MWHSENFLKNIVPIFRSLQKLKLIHFHRFISDAFYPILCHCTIKLAHEITLGEILHFHFFYLSIYQCVSLQFFYIFHNLSFFLYMEKNLTKQKCIKLVRIRIDQNIAFKKIMYSVEIT